MGEFQMFRAVRTTVTTVRLLAMAMLAAMLAAAALVGPLAPPSAAATFTASDEDSWRTAVAAADADGTSFHTITLTDDIHFDDATGDTPTLNNASSLIIDGAGHTVTSTSDNAAQFINATVGGSLSLENITFEGFTADSVATLTGSPGWVLLRNVVVRDSVGSGSAIVAACGSNLFAVIDSEFTGNSSTSDGGALNIDCGPSTVHASTFSDNEGDSGGAIYSQGPLTVTGSTFSDNQADFGGAVYGFAGAVVTNSTLTGNQALTRGGALYGRTGDVRASHVTFASNGAGIEGDHVDLLDGYFRPYASVFTDALGSGDGCAVTVEVPDVGYINSLDSQGYNFDQDGTCAEAGDVATDFGGGEDPQLGALADNQGPTETMLPASDSPLVDAIDTGDCDTAIVGNADLEFAQRGVERPQGAGCDVGAVEVIHDTAFTIPTANGDVDVLVQGATCVEDDAAYPVTGLGAPADLSFPFGMFEYSFCVPGDGWSVDLELDLPSPVTSLWKVSGSDWSEVTSASISDTVVSYSLTDGGALDEDGEANSYIVDPVAPGIGASFTG